MSQLPDMFEICAALLKRGAYIGPEQQVGRHCPAIADGYAWEVCSKNGTILVLCHDEVQAAGWYLLIASGEAPIGPQDGEPIKLISSAELVIAKKLDSIEQLEQRGYLTREEATQEWNRWTS